MPNSTVERRLELSNPVIVIVGPTASGKTDVAQEIARRVNGEVISADSMQIYKGMDIGTGKLPESERFVPHWGFDIREPGEAYSASLFQEYARSCFADIDARLQFILTICIWPKNITVGVPCHDDICARC